MLDKDNADIEFKRIQEKILDKTISLSFFVLLAILPFSLSRAFETGLQPAHHIQIFLIFIQSLSVLLKNKFSYEYKFTILVLILFVQGSTGIANFGLLGQGYIALIFTTVLSSLLTSKKYYQIVLFINIITISIIGYLYTTQFLNFTFNPYSYNSNIYSWLTMIVVFSLPTGYLAALTSELLNEIKIFAKEKSESNFEKDRILGVVAHDITNKLGGIMSYLSLLKHVYKELSEEEKLKFIEDIYETSSFALETVKDLHDYTTSPETLTTEKIEICPFIQSTVECNIPKALLKKISINVNQPATKILCNINKAKLSRVIDNLLTNAIKFTPENGKITVELKPDTNYIVISVKDNGIGIPDKLKPDIFEPYTSAGRQGTANEKTTGLGLSIAKQIVSLHNGEIWFESIEKIGTTFYLKLPIVKII